MAIATMSNENESASTLNGLIETLKDGQKGFATAAADVKDAGVKSTFEKFAAERARLASELQTYVHGMGEASEKSGSVAGAMHRGWINLKSALGGGEKAILNEAERGEDEAVKSYEKALEKSLPPGVAEVVRRQYSQVKAAHDQVRMLRDSWK